MVNYRQLDLLTHGERHWKQWRNQHPNVLPDLSEAYLNGADLSGLDLSRANLARADLSGADLQETNLWGADLHGALLMRANLSRANLSHANLHEAALYRATLERTNLAKANLTRANLSRASLSGANLQEANLYGTNLTHAHFHDTDMRAANLHEAEMDDTILAQVDLSAVNGLETVRHRGPSTIGVDTIFRSQGNIPEVFLREAGLADILLTYLPSLVGRPIDFYRCFIGFSRFDYAFARRLYADLQSEGVRCWLVPDERSELNADEVNHARIDEPIRLCDRFLLVLSEQTIAHSGIAQEIERVVTQEQQQQRAILVPICLDATALTREEDWLVRLRATHRLENFSRWKRYDVYQKAFRRLLQDLKEASLVL